MRRLAAVLVAVGVVLVFGSRSASAMVPTDPWVPPSVATHEGLGDSTLALGGVSVPLSGTPADVYVAPATGSYCTQAFTSWGYVGGALTVVVSVSGPNASWCDGNGVWTSPYPSFGCLVTASFTEGANTHQAGDVVIRGATDTYGIFSSKSFTPTTLTYEPKCSSAGVQPLVLWWVDFAGTGPGSFTQAGLRAYVPGVSQAPTYSIVTACSDGSSVTVTALAGLPVAPAACVTGSLVSVTVSAGGAAVSTTTVHPDFQGNPCLASAGVCRLWVTWSGGSCANDDPSCSWWGTESPADACGWKDGAGQMWALTPGDCEAARHDGFDVPLNAPPPTGTPTPDPTPDPTLGRIEQAVKDILGFVQSWKQGMDVYWQRQADQMSQGVADVTGAIARAVSPDAGVIGAATARAQGAMGAPLSGWTSALGDMAGAWSAGSGSCSGPVMQMPVFGSFVAFSPLDACSGYGAMLAPIVHLGATVLLLWEGAWVCARNLGNAFGYSA